MKLKLDNMPAIRQSANQLIRSIIHQNVQSYFNGKGMQLYPSIKKRRSNETPSSCRS